MTEPLGHDIAECSRGGRGAWYQIKRAQLIPAVVRRRYKFLLWRWAYFIVSSLFFLVLFPPSLLFLGFCWHLVHAVLMKKGEKDTEAFLCWACKTRSDDHCRDVIKLQRAKMEGTESKPSPSLPWWVSSCCSQDAPSYCTRVGRYFSAMYVLFGFRVEKYRPKSLDDLISHKEVISTSECTALHVNVNAWGVYETKCIE